MNEVSGTVHGPVVQAGRIEGGVHFHGQAKPRLDPIALYYPYIHVRDDTWLKYAALYWPNLGRVVPEDYPVRDSAVAVELDQALRWVLNVSPQSAAAAVGYHFLNLIYQHAEELRQRYGIQHVRDWQVYGSDSGNSAGPPAQLNPKYTYIHLTKVPEGLLTAIVDAGLGAVAHGRGGRWLGVHPVLAGVYLCALAEEVARQQHMHPVTDRPLPHAALSGWTFERLAGVLLDDHEPASPRTSPRTGDPVDGFVVAAFETVVPANLGSVPVDKIIEVRQRYRRELNAYREYVTAQVDELTRLTDVRDVAVYRAHLAHEVERTITDKLDDLRERLLDLGLEPATALATVKTPLSVEGTEPGPDGTGALATRVVDVPQRLRDRTIRSSPVGYLFHVGEQLSTSALADRVCDAIIGA